MHRYALLPLLLLVALVAGTTMFAVDDKAAQYIGGTVAGLSEKAEGTLDTSADMVAFDARSAGSVEIPYTSITSLEYGERSDDSAATAMVPLPTVLSSTPKHYLTIRYSDAGGTEQSAVFELGTQIVRDSMKILEKRSGEPISYLGKDARESAMGEK